MKSLAFTSARVRNAFSLVEVVVAVGVFAIAIVSVIGILAGVGKSVTEVSDADKAARLIGVVQARLQSAGFDNVRGALGGTSFYASEDGSIVAQASDLAWEKAAGADQAKQNALKYFELSLIRNASLSPSGNDDSAGFLAFNIRMRWPAYLPDGTQVTDDTQKEVLIIPAAITR